MKDYTELTLRVHPRDPFTEILLASMEDLPFTMFEETADGLKAYADEGAITEEDIINFLAPFSSEAQIEFEINKVASRNWNELWESNFEPVEVEDRVSVRAEFHPPVDGFEFDIRITPKMSFGTGHHQTTWLMIKAMFDIPMKGLFVLDMGCGTGILAILAAMKGSESVLAVDIDEWPAVNATENCKINAVEERVTVMQGDAALLEGRRFNVILANINRNVLLEQIPVYSKVMAKGGSLLMSGFYQDDIPAITKEAQSFGFDLAEQQFRDQWALLKFTKRA